MADATLDEIIRLADKLTFADKRKLVEHLARELQQKRAEVAPQDLYGIWRGRFPEDFEIDAALREIRHEWEGEWPEVFKG